MKNLIIIVVLVVNFATATFASASLWLVSNDKTHWNIVKNGDLSDNIFKVQISKESLLHTQISFMSFDEGFTWYDTELLSNMWTSPSMTVITYFPYSRYVFKDTLFEQLVESVNSDYVILILLTGFVICIAITIVSEFKNDKSESSDSKSESSVSMS